MLIIVEIDTVGSTSGVCCKCTVSSRHSFNDIEGYNGAQKLKLLPLSILEHEPILHAHDVPPNSSNLINFGTLRKIHNELQNY